MKWFWKREEEPKKARRSVPEGKDLRDESTLLTGDAAEDSRSLEILLDTIAAVTANMISTGCSGISSTGPCR